jgi:hypothetical protein
MSVNGPCNLTRAVEMIAQDGDEVFVNPGTYSADIDIATSIFLHGVAGQPRPEIVGTQAGLEATDPGAANASVRYLGLTGPLGLRIAAVNVTVDQVISRGTDISSAGCFVNPAAPAGVAISNSVCRGAPGSRGIRYDDTGGITDSLTLRNVTAFASDTVAGGNGILVVAGTGSNVTLDAKNVVADGETDVNAGVGAGNATATLSYSNYATRAPVTPTGGDSVTDPAAPTNQTAAPVFADADLHQAANSPTINNGNLVDTVGLFDVDGGARTVGTAPDIGADEFVPAAVTPPVPCNPLTVGGLKGKKLTLTFPCTGAVAVADGGGKNLKPSSASGGPGEVVVALKLAKKAKQKLKEKGKVTVRAKITFTPTGGTAASQTAKLKIKP